MSYTERFSEVYALLGTINPDDYSGEQNTGYVSLANYHRAVIIIHCGVIAANIDVDIEQATDTAGSNPKSLDSASKDIALTALTDSDTVSVIEIRTEELDVDGGFDCINVEATVDEKLQVTSLFYVEIWGAVPRFAAVATTALDSVTD